ncbi:MAG: FRG domain-containing protein [Candidatus Didemnitutus sp.]|nr:FRG domain-containing protein [Candidatus Didemnitutus sp.]
MLHKGATNKEIRNGQGRDIRSFPSLAHAVASLSFYNRDHVLLFRGQGEDFRNLDDNTSIQPKIFRGYRNELRFEWHAIINDRYMRLVRAEELLVEAWKRNKLPDQLRIERHRSIRWAVIQHYEICATPLLDVTQSLRIAATFALRNAVDDEAFLYVLAVPQIS